MDLNILGTQYIVALNVDPESDKDLNGKLGYCDMVKKTIVLADAKKCEGWEDESGDTIAEQIKRTMRHEIIHAFLAESGLWGSSGNTSAWALNEEMVDWIALQFSKILRACEEANAI